MNISDAKNKLVDALGSMDLTNMSLNDLALYAQVLRAAADIPTVDPVDAAIEASKKIYSAFIPRWDEDPDDVCLGISGG